MSESDRPSRLVRVGSSSRARRPDTRPRITAERHLASTRAGRGGGGQLRAASGASGVRVLDGDQDGGAPGELLLAVAHAAARRARDGRRGAQARRPYGATSFGGKRLKSSRRVGKCQVCSCCMSFALEFCDAESREVPAGRVVCLAQQQSFARNGKKGVGRHVGNRIEGPDAPVGKGNRLLSWFGRNERKEVLSCTAIAVWYIGLLQVLRRLSELKDMRAESIQTQIT